MLKTSVSVVASLFTAASLVLATAPAMAQDSSVPAAAPTEATPAPVAPPAAADVIANIDQVSPYNLIYVVDQFWARGDKLQSAFWFYIFQIRTQPWGEINTDAATTRNMLSNQYGNLVNTWIAADPDQWKAIAARAISYEKALPMWPEHHPQLTSAQWGVQVTVSREQYEKDFIEAFANTTNEQIAASRTEAGLPVGALTDGGTPLPEAWR